jgi:excinuclease UvrABC ATPase subunit
LDTPFKKLPKDIQEIILYGDSYFEGVIPFLERKWKEGGEATKEEVEKYMRVKICPVCH